eukprot:sb/3477258/
MAISRYLKKSKLFYGFINVAFNHYDKERVSKIGPDAAAAEWLLKNEGSIRGRGFSTWIEDYSGVSVCYTPKFKIAKIQAVDADITSGGCEHFKGLDYLHVYLSQNTVYS